MAHKMYSIVSKGCKKRQNYKHQKHRQREKNKQQCGRFKQLPYTETETSLSSRAPQKN